VQRILGLGLLLGDHSAADGHHGGDDAVDALVLGGLEVAGRILDNGDVSRPSSGSPVAAIGEPAAV
jgi:hypothetical protein